MIFEENFDSICRICLKKCTHMRQISHVDPRSPGKLTVIEMLKHCASVQVEEGDGLPQQVCVKCILRMRKCVLLEQAVISSDATLRSVLKSKNQQPTIETIYLDCPLDCYKTEEEIITSNVIDITTEIGQMHTNKEMVASLEHINIENANMGTEIINTTVVIDVPSKNDNTETKTMEQNNSVVASSQYLNNFENIEHLDIIPADKDSDINCGVDETDFGLPVDHSYFNHDEAEITKEKKTLYYCTSTFNDNQKFHLHFTEEHPKAFSYPFLENLLQSGKLQLQTEKLLEETSALDAKIIKERHEQNPQDDPKPQNSHFERESSESLNPEDKIKKQVIPQLKKTQKRKSKLLKDTSLLDTKKVKKKLEKNAKDAPKTKDGHKETENLTAPDPEDKTIKQPLPQRKKLRYLNGKPCNICGKTFKRANSIYSHMRLHTGERPHMCHECGMTFKQMSHLQVHQSTHAGIKNSVCEVCGKRFLNQTNLTCHMRSHMSPTHKCTQCPKVFRLEKQLDLHVRIVHVGEQIFKCSFEECKDTPGYSAQQSLNNHLKLRHANSSEIKSDKPFRCSLCPISFSKQNYLDKHMKTHTKDKSNNLDRLDCNICGKVLASREGLKHHYLRHGHLRTLECHICNRSFSDESKLNAHIRFHERPKPHECTTCHKRFVDKSALRVHNRTHTGEKPYKCEICGNRFTVKKALQTHVNNHNGILPYECKLCEKKYPSRGWLNAHMLNVHKLG